jgi:hypothetical protein
LPDFLKKLNSYSGDPITKLALRLTSLSFSARSRKTHFRKYPYLCIIPAWLSQACHHARIPSAGSTILNETDFRPDVIERQLAHVEQNKVRAAYHRSEYLDERRRMMNWWGAYIESMAKDQKLVLLRRKPV